MADYALLIVACCGYFGVIAAITGVLADEKVIGSIVDASVAITMAISETIQGILRRTSVQLRVKLHALITTKRRTG